MLLTVQDICKELKICKSTFYKLVKVSFPPPAFSIGKHPRWRREAVESWITSQEQQQLHQA